MLRPRRRLLAPGSLLLVALVASPFAGAQAPARPVSPPPPAKPAAPPVAKPIAPPPVTKPVPPPPPAKPAPGKPVPGKPGKPGKPEPEPPPPPAPSDDDEVERLLRDADEAFAKGRLTVARNLYQRAGELREKKGKDDPGLVRIFRSWGEVLALLGDTDMGFKAAQRAFQLANQKFGDKSDEAIRSMSVLGRVFLLQNDLDKADLLLRPTLIYREEQAGPNDPRVIEALTDLATATASRRAYDRSLELAERAMKLVEKHYSANDLRAAALHQILGDVNRGWNDLAKAKAHYDKAAAIRERSLGRDHYLTAETWIAQGNVARAEGDRSRALSLWQRSLDVYERAFGQAHARVVDVVFGLGLAALELGETKRASDLLDKAIQLHEKAPNRDKAKLVDLLQAEAIVHARLGDPRKAMEVVRRGTDLSEGRLVELLGTGAEREKEGFLNAISAEKDLAVGLNVQKLSSDAAATRLGMETLLRRKGRVLDSVAQATAALRATPEGRAQVQEIASLRSSLARLELASGASGTSKADYEDIKAKLYDKLRRLEQDASRAAVKAGTKAEAPTLAAVQAALPARSALVEFVAYMPLFYDAKQKGDLFDKPRYAAYVVRPSGDPQVIDLGEFFALDADLRELRAALSTPKSTNAKELARKVDEQVMRPIRRVLGDTSEIYLAPDGTLNLVPFGALVDEDGKFLNERFSLRYVMSGRDLVRIKAAPKGDGKNDGMVVLFANPDYDKATWAIAKSKSMQRSAEGHQRDDKRAKIQAKPLAGTADEADALRKVYPQAALLTGPDATEAAVKKVKSPKILHVATHGFFFDDEKLTAMKNKAAGTPDAARRLEYDPTTAPPAAAGGPEPEVETIHRHTGGNNPLLYSWLAMAGFNFRSGGQDTNGISADGVLTATEVSGMDLSGTKLVVLSACETGVGAVSPGEGVYGLRRAFAIAGAETQVMSLWQVNDAAGRDLMIDYYTRLRRGEGRSDALRLAQLTMAAKAGTSHPYYWSTYIVSGDPSPLESAGPDIGEVVRVRLKSGGCGCEVVDTSRTGGPVATGLLFAATLSLLFARRRRRGGEKEVAR